VYGFCLNPLYNFLANAGFSLWLLLPLFLVLDILFAALLTIYLFKFHFSKQFKILVALYSAIGSLIWRLIGYALYKIAGISYFLDEGSISFLSKSSITLIVASAVMGLPIIFGIVYWFTSVGNRIGMWVIKKQI
jgi:hypothetical protein